MRQFELVERVQAYDKTADEALLNRAYVYAMKAHSHQRRANGDPYFSHPLEVAAILTELHLDDATIATALLHDVIEDTESTRAEIDHLFGDEIGSLVEGLTKIKRLDLVTQKAEQAENFRKLLLAISSDVRVLLVKLADRLHNMRTLGVMKPHKRARISEETLEIYAPLAGRMGMQTLRDELEDHSFRWLKPDAYEMVTKRLAALEEKNAGLVEGITTEIEKLLADTGIQGQITARAKRPYSIWRKMENRKISLEQLSDIYGFRIVVSTTEECYRLLGAIHTRWSAVPGRFKDYISTPKQNDYRSLHTTVVGPRRQRVELQIRTRSMQEIAEYGIAAHAVYADLKSRPAGVSVVNGKAAPQCASALAAQTDIGPYMRLRRLVEQLLEGHSPEEFLEHTKLELFHDQVFCFTPKGRLIALPSGATPIDFAYAVHTDVGNSAVGVIVNGQHRPLTSTLNNGDEVEILRGANGRPSPTWEKIVSTGRARAAIRRATRDAIRQQYSELGLRLLTARLAETGVPYADAVLDGALPKLGRHTRLDVLAGIARNEIPVDDVVRAIVPNAELSERIAEYRPRNRYDHGHGQDGWFNLTRVMGLKFRVAEPNGKDPAETQRLVREAVPLRGLQGDVAVDFKGSGAVPGDRIVGVMLPGAGIKVFQIHSPKLRDHEHHPWIDVTWDLDPDAPERFLAWIAVTARNEPGALAKIAAIIGNQDGNIDNLKMTDRAADFTRMLIELEVWELPHLNKIIAELRASADVSDVDRVFDI